MTPRRVGAGLAFLAAVFLLLGTFTMRWLKAPKGEGGVGLTGIEMCDHGNCKSEDWDQLTRGGRADKEVELLKMAAMAALIGSVLAASLLATVGIFGLATQKSMSLVTIFSILGSILALAGAIATVVLLKKYFRHEHMAFGYSFYAYVAGCVLGLVGSIVSRGGRGYATPRA